MFLFSYLDLCSIFHYPNIAIWFNTFVFYIVIIYCHSSMKLFIRIWSYRSAPFQRKFSKHIFHNWFIYLFYMLQNSYIGFLDFKKEAIKKLGMRANTCSFNPGVFVANLTEWKQQNITSQLEFWMERNAKLVVLPETTTLN